MRTAPWSSTDRRYPWAGNDGAVRSTTCPRLTRLPPSSTRRGLGSRTALWSAIGPSCQAVASGFMDVAIRPYRAEDRQAVREICYATGYMGDSPAWYWRDR